ncbi:tetratricopeptide repeat protein, partial [candidate division CSSED10-310 bacterium]
NDISPNTYDRLSQIFAKKEIAIEDKEKLILERNEKYKNLEKRLLNRSGDNQLIAKAKDKLSSGDLDGAEKLLEQSLADYLVPERKRYFPQVKFFAGLYFRIISLLSVKHSLKQIKGVPKKAVVESVYELGLIKELKMEYQEALYCFEKAVQYDRENTLYLNQLAGIFYTLGNYNKAVINYDKALAADLKTYQQEDPEVLIAWNILDSTPDSLGQREKTIEYYEKGLAAFLKAYGAEHPRIAASWNNLGGAWEKLSQYENAIEHYEKALKVFEKVYGKDHPDTKIVADNLKKAKN